MGPLRVLLMASASAWLMGVSARARGPSYGVGRTPPAEEIRALDISIGPTGAELPPGQGTAKEGAQLYRSKGCAGCHGAAEGGGSAANLKTEGPHKPDGPARGRNPDSRPPVATTGRAYSNRWLPRHRQAQLT